MTVAAFFLLPQQKSHKSVLRLFSGIGWHFCCVSQQDKIPTGHCNGLIAVIGQEQAEDCFTSSEMSLELLTCFKRPCGTRRCVSLPGGSNLCEAPVVLHSKSCLWAKRRLTNLLGQPRI